MDELSSMEHRRWCAEYLLRGFRPLLSLDLNQPGWNHKLSPDDEELIRGWFGQKDAKQKQRNKKYWKALYRHVDLMLYEYLDDVITPDLKGDNETESAKDFKQISFILDKKNYESLL